MSVVDQLGEVAGTENSTSLYVGGSWVVAADGRWPTHALAISPGGLKQLPVCRYRLLPVELYLACRCHECLTYTAS